MISRTLLYLYLSIFIFVIVFFMVALWFNRTVDYTLVNSPTPSVNPYIGPITNDIVYGNLCGSRDVLKDSAYISDNYITIVDPTNKEEIRYNGVRNKRGDDNPLNPMENFNTKYAGDNKCRRCIGVNPDLYKDINLTEQDAVNDMKQCRLSAEDTCRTSCTFDTDCLGYLVTERKWIFPPPLKVDDRYKPFNRNSVREYTSCDNKSNHLYNNHDIYCTKITNDDLVRKNYVCNTNQNICLGPNSNYNALENIPFGFCTQNEQCVSKPKDTFNSYKNIQYTCGHDSSIGGKYGEIWEKYRIKDVAPSGSEIFPYIMQGNSNLIPSRYADQLAYNPFPDIPYYSVSRRGLLKNNLLTNQGWQTPTLPMPTRNQWYMPCQVLTHTGQGAVDPIDIGTANYVFLSPSFYNETISIEKDWPVDSGTSDTLPYPQVAAQRKCEELCTTQSLSRPTSSLDVEGFIPPDLSTTKNRNYACGGYSLKQETQGGSTSQPTNFTCKLYDTNATAIIPYTYTPRPPSGDICVPGPNNPCPPTLKTSITDACNFTMEEPIVIPKFPTSTISLDLQPVENVRLNKHITQLIRAGYIRPNVPVIDYSNEKTFYNMSLIPGSGVNPTDWSDCLKSSPHICSLGNVFGKVRTNSKPPIWISDYPNVQLPSGTSNIWYPWKFS